MKDSISVYYGIYGPSSFREMAFIINFEKYDRIQFDEEDFEGDWVFSCDGDAVSDAEIEKLVKEFNAEEK